MTDEEVKAYTNAFAKAQKIAQPKVYPFVDPKLYMVESETRDVTYEVLLGPDKTLEGAKCQCDNDYQHISCYHRALAFNYYVDHVLYTKLEMGWCKVFQYEDEQRPKEFISGKEELFKAQLRKYEDLCKWRKQFTDNNKPKGSKPKGDKLQQEVTYDSYK